MKGGFDNELQANLNRMLLASQNLTNKASGRQSLVSIAMSCCGINSQNYTDSFLSFWARSDSFLDKDLLSELRPKGRLTRSWTVRGTVHTFPSQEYYTYVFGSPQERILSRHDNYARQLGVPPREVRIEKLYEPLLDEIKGKSVPTDFISNFISERLELLGIKGKMMLDRGWSGQLEYGPTWKGIIEMSYMGLLVNAGRKGSGSLWMRTDEWLKSGIKPAEPDECAKNLIRLYIEKYGPVTESDILYWSGHRKKEVANSIRELRSDLVVEKFGASNELFYSMNGIQYDAPDPPDAIILPRFDSLMMGYEDKTRFMKTGHRDYIFRSAGIISQTLLLNGLVAGTWKKEKKRGVQSISVLSFRDLKVREKKAVEERFQDYASYADTEFKLEFKQISA